MSSHNKVEIEPALKYVNYNRFIRFCIIGFSNFIVSFSIFKGMIFLLGNIWLSASISQLFSYSGGAIWSYYWNRKWSFKSNANIKKEAPQFFIVQLICLSLSSISIGFFVDYFSFDKNLTWFCVMSGITLLNFFLLNACVFSKSNCIRA